MNNQYMNHEGEFEKKLMELKQTDHPIVLFGTMTMGKIGKKSIDYLCKKVSCFCDNDNLKQGTMIEDIPILSIEKIKSDYLNAKIYICSFNKDNIKAITKQLSDMGFKNIYDFSLLFWIYEFKIIKRNISMEEFTKLVETVYSKDDKLILRNVGVMVTEKCNLRCKNCAGLIPHIKNPKNHDKEEIILGMKKLSDSVDAIESIGIFGGEPLLYPDLIEICTEAVKLKNVRTVGIVTNGTVIPSEKILKGLSELGVFVTISDYGKVSDKIEELEGIFKDHNIVYEIFDKNIPWYQTNFPKKHNRTYDENVRLFKECECFIAKKCPLLQNGKLFICGYHATIDALGLFSGRNEDYVDLIHNVESIQEIRKKIKRLFYNSELIEACDYCELCEKILVPRAEQIDIKE